jgi:hypothetical protein
MPPGKPLAPEVISDFQLWAKAGAPVPEDRQTAAQPTTQQQFWSFRAPKPQAPPAPKNTTWARNDIDRFIQAKLEEKQLEPSPEADRRTLIRRVSYDLTGLPPTAAEITAFVNDKSRTHMNASSTVFSPPSTTASDGRDTGWISPATPMPELPVIALPGPTPTATGSSTRSIPISHTINS